ncbi:MAG: secretin N-terminal domain-containing protein [Thermoanaerobaculia bacterium]
MKKSKFLLLIILVASMVSCTSFRAYQKAQQFAKVENWDRAVEEYSKALEVDPGNMKYKIGLEQAKLEASRVHFEKGKSLRAAGHDDLAALEFELTVKLDPTNQYAAVELGKAIAALRSESEVRAHRFEEKQRNADQMKAQPPELNPASNEPISLSFPHETPVKDIYRSLGNAFGINILFDPAVKDDKIAIELHDVTAQQALERVMQAANQFYKVLDEKTIIVVPDTPQLRRQYEDLVIRTFYLSNADAEQVTNVLRTMLEARNVFPLKALNAITIRDTADKVKIAQKIIEANDKAKAEVVIDVELLQMDVKKARDLGAQLVGANGAVGFVGADGASLGAVRLNELGQLSSSDLSFTLPSLAYGFVKSTTNAELLAKPQLRISEGEKATLTIGEKIPVPVTTFTGTNVATPGNSGTFVPFTSYQYQDVGIKISIEPRVHHNREVSLKLSIEVSNLSGYAPNSNQPIIATRTIESIIRLKDGETNFLAGLIRRDDTSSNDAVPFLGDIPLIGRIFSHEKKDHQATDLVLTLTPHIVRIPDITEEDLAPMWVGTQNNMTFRGFSPRLESNATADPFASDQNQRAQFSNDNTGTPAMQQEQPQPAQPQPAQPGPIQGTAPSSPFRETPPPPPPPTPESQNAAPGTSVKAAASSGPAGRFSFAPRIAAQPSTMTIEPGREMTWDLVGMDLEGLSTEQLVIHYDPMALDIAAVDLGDALSMTPDASPVAQLDAANGTITIGVPTGARLKFRSGGEIARIHVRGGVRGVTYLAVDNPVFVNAGGNAVAAEVTGGRAQVQ